MSVNSFEPGRLSWWPKKEELKTPYYRSLADLLETDIRSGVLPGGARLPSQRELADFLDIHFTTVTRAYEECKKRNLIYGAAGSGTFVNPQAVTPISNSMDTRLRHQEKFGYETAIEMGFVSSFEETNEIVAENLPRIFTKTDISSHLNYTNPTGTERQKEIGLQWMARYGIHASSSQVAIVSGGMNALTICFLSLFKAGDRVAVDYYINNNIIELAKLLRIQLVPIQMDQDGMLPEALEQACQQTSIQGIHLMPCCSNPTTVRLSIARKAALSHVIQKHHLIVLEDDLYAFSVVGKGGDYAVPMFELLPEQTVYICSTTASICSALRIAFMAFPYRFLEALNNAISNINVKSSALDAVAVCEMIESGLAERIAAKKIALAMEANEIFNGIFPDNVCQNPAAFFRWLKIPAALREAPVGWELLSRGVHVYHSRRFLCGGEEDDGYLRIALSSANSLEHLREGFLKIKRYYEESR